MEAREAGDEVLLGRRDGRRPEDERRHDEEEEEEERGGHGEPAPSSAARVQQCKGQRWGSRTGGVGGIKHHRPRQKRIINQPS